MKLTKIKLAFIVLKSVYIINGDRLSCLSIDGHGARIRVAMFILWRRFCALYFQLYGERESSTFLCPVFPIIQHDLLGDL
jgi:hypothetical protein